MSRSPYIALREGQQEHPWRMALLILVLLGVMLIIAYGILSITPARVTIDTETQTNTASTVENPELSLYFRYNDAAQAHAKAAFLANNPELLIMQHYVNLPAAAGERAFLARNPELIAAGHYQAGRTPDLADRFLAQNPEIILFRRYTGE